MTDEEKEARDKEIFTSLMVVADQYEGGPTKAAFEMNYVPKLSRFHGVELFRVITGIPGQYREFPTSWELERVMQEKDKNLLKELEDF